MSFSIHFSLSNFDVGAAAADEVAVLEAVKIDVVGVLVVADVTDFWELSSTAVAGEDETVDASATGVFAGPAGEEKNEVIEAFTLGFLAVEVAISTALRLTGVAILGGSEGMSN